MEAGRNILERQDSTEYPRFIGWPFILSISFFIFGLNNWVAIYTSIFLGALTIFPMFFMAFLITKRKNLSLIATIFFPLFPAHIRWSATAGETIASLFFIIISIFFCFLYYRNKKTSLFWLAIISLIFASQFRPENTLFLVFFFLGCFIFEKESFKRKILKFIFPAILWILLSSANFIHSLSFRLKTNWITHMTGQAGENWSLYNLINNFINYTPHIFNHKFQPFIISFIVILGACYMFHKQKKENLFLLTWIFLMLFVYFFSYFQVLGGTEILGKSRFFLNFYPLMVIFISYGVLYLKNLFCLNPQIRNSKINKMLLPSITIILIISFIPHTISASTWYAHASLKLQSEMPELAEKDVPPECIILAEWPEILKASTHLNVINSQDFLYYKNLREKVFKEYECVLVFKELYSDNDDSPYQEIKEKFPMTEFIIYNITYKGEYASNGFYKITPK